MSDSRAVDRLPWLADEPAPSRAPVRRGARDLLGWAAAAVMLVAGVSFWLGTRSEQSQSLPATAQKAAPPSMIVPLPQVRVTPAPQVAQAPAPEVRTTPVRQVHAAPQRTIRLTRAEAMEARRAAAERRVERKLAAAIPVEAKTAPAPVAQAAPPAIVTRAAPLRPWQPRVVTGAAGRLVEVGAFGTVPQAKLGWRYMVRTYPAVAHLPAVVRPDRNSRGRVFYRFRVGTTSQAHSEVLCQRMEKIQLSCAIVGLPWKAKVER